MNDDPLALARIVWRLVEPLGPSMGEAVEAHYFERLSKFPPPLRNVWLRCTMSAAEDHRELHAGLVRIARRLRAETPDGALPRVLVDWLVGVADKALPSSRGACLGMRPGTGGRDLAIVHTILVVREACGISATRNDASDVRSACDVVAELTGLSYDRVRQVWRDHRESAEALWQSGVLRVGNA